MCGFLALIGKRELRKGFCRGVQKATAVMEHRGPDDFQTLDHNLYQLRFWRLSIVDRSHGRQPMVSPDQQIVVLFNGEIYNYSSTQKQLSKLGVKFQTDSDTEVILHSYAVWGSECFSRFEGMFSICIVDHRHQRVVLARDPLGVKPLYYYHDKHRLVIASEPKAILATGALKPRLDQASFQQYILFQTILDSHTLFAGVSKVQPGSVLEFDLNSCQLITTKNIQSTAKHESFSTYAECVDQTRKVLEYHLALALETDLPVCFHLSGGLDSNTLVSLCRKIQPNRKFVCVTSLIDGKKDEEWPLIQQSAKMYGCSLDVVNVTCRRFFEILDDVLFALDEPVGDPGVVPQFLVDQLVSKHAKIVFSGQGLDEMFFGYIRDLAAYVLATKGRASLNPNASQYERLPAATKGFFKGWEDFLNSLTKNAGLSPEFLVFKKLCRIDPFVPNSFLPNEFLQILKDTALNIYHVMLKDSPSLNEFLVRAETQIQLPALLHMEDRASMRYSIETRVPFCTLSVLRLAKDLDIKWKLYNGSPKGILRDCFRNILPSHIVDRKKKIGRPVPLRKWLNHKEGRPYLEKLHQQQELFKELFRADILKYATDNPNPYDRTFWMLLCLSRWLDLYKVSI